LGVRFVRIAICLITFTRNSAKELNRLLRSISDYVDEIVVVDGCSTDSTVEVAERFGAKLYRRRPWGYPDPDRMFGLKQCSSPWVIYLDVDELPSPRLKTDLKELIERAERYGYDAISLPRYNVTVWKGKVQLVLGLWWPDYQIRVFHRDNIYYKGLIHEQPIVYGRILYLDPYGPHYIIHIHDKLFQMSKSAKYIKFHVFEYSELKSEDPVERALFKLSPLSYLTFIAPMYYLYIALKKPINIVSLLIPLFHSHYIMTVSFLMKLRSKKQRIISRIVEEKGLTYYADQLKFGCNEDAAYRV